VQAPKGSTNDRKRLGSAHGCPQELASWVEPLLDDLVRPLSFAKTPSVSK